MENSDLDQVDRWPFSNGSAFTGTASANIVNDTIVAAAADSEAETISLDEAEDASGDDDDDDVSNIVVGGEDEDDT